MSHRNAQAKFIGQLLQTKFPEPRTAAVWVTAIGLNQQFLLTGVSAVPDLDPPQSDCGDGKFRRLTQNANDHKTVVGTYVVSPIRDGHSISVTRIILFQNRNRLSALRAASVLEVTDQFALFRIHADDRITRVQNSAAHLDQISHLSVARWVLLSCQSFAIDTNRITQFLQQSPNRGNCDFETFTFQNLLKCVQSFARPLQASHRIACVGILQQFIPTRGGRTASGRWFFTCPRAPSDAPTDTDAT